MVVEAGKPPPFTGAMDCFKQTVRADGFRGLYRGMAAPLYGVTPIFALCFWAYELAKSQLVTLRGLAGARELSLFDCGVAGALSAVPTTAIMAPGERIKCILQVQQKAVAPAGAGAGSPPAAAGLPFKGPGDVVRHLVRTEGYRSLFRGSAATLLRDGSGSFAYFSVYEGIKRALTPAGSTQLSPTAVVLGGGFAGVCNWLVALPFDVVKSRIQAHMGPGAPPSMMGVAQELLRKEGVGGLYRGASPALLRAFPANAACFTGMELSKSLMDSLF